MPLCTRPKSAAAAQSRDHDTEHKTSTLIRTRAYHPGISCSYKLACLSYTMIASQASLCTQQICCMAPRCRLSEVLPCDLQPEPGCCSHCRHVG